MKRILFASWYTGLGGGETDLLTLARSLDAKRFELHLLLPKDGQLAERWRAVGLPVHILPFRGASTYFVPGIWGRFPVVNRFAELLKRGAHRPRTLRLSYASADCAGGETFRDSPALDGLGLVVQA